MQDLVKRYNMDVDDVDYRNRSALHVAAARGHMPVVSWLVNQMQANISMLDESGVSPLYEAVRHRHHNVVKFLRNRKADLVSEDREGIDVAVAGSNTQAPSPALHSRTSNG